MKTETKNMEVIIPKQMVAAMGAQRESFTISMGITATAVDDDVWKMGLIRLHPALKAASLTDEPSSRNNSA